MKELKTFLVLSLVLSACSSQRYENDKNDPHYQKGDYFPFAKGNPEGAGGNAMLGLVASGIALTANRGYYKSTALTGKCLCSNGALALPCGSVDVVITDLSDRALGTTKTDENGEFAFRVPQGPSFRLEVKSDKYKLEKPIDRKLSLGDDVILKLVPRP